MKNEVNQPITSSVKAWPMIVSGVLLAFGWPVLAVTSIMLSDSPNLTPREAAMAAGTFYSTMIVPLTWIVCLILWFVERKRKKRKPLLTAYLSLPFLSYLVPVMMLFLTLPA